MATVGSPNSFGASDTYYYEQSDTTSQESTEASSGVLSAIFWFFYKMATGEYDDGISSNLDKAVGLIQVTWKFILFFTIAIFSVVWVMRKRNSIYKEYAERKKQINNNY